MKIGIIGHGYVGRAVAASYPHHELSINDPQYVNYPQYQSVTYIHKNCDVIFVCVPTPQSDTGECDTSILDSVFAKLSGTKALVIVKSTAPPDYYAALEQRVDFKVAHVPEFLTAARAELDYLNPHKIVVGCSFEIQHEVANALMTSNINFERLRIEYCSIAEASFFKYLANTMLATKVIIANEYKALADRLDLKWSHIINIAKTDHRLGDTHWSAPGPDGQPGYGGACFPKDVSAMLKFARDHNADLTVLNQAHETNKKLRK